MKGQRCATVLRRKSLPEASTRDGEFLEEESGLVRGQVGQEVTETSDSSSRVIEPTEVCQTTLQDGRSEAVTSLVADYSDSDSDPGQ